MSKRAIVYVDGFNLYYGLYKGPRGQPPTCPAAMKWLDMSSLAASLVPHLTVLEVKVFTAQVKDSIRDPDQSTRQRVLWAAWATRQHPPITLIKGRFNTVQKRGFVSNVGNSSAVRGEFLEIETFEEKGTDVNLASHLIADAFQQRCDESVVISCDTDLLDAIRITQRDAGLPVHIVNPTRRNGKALQNIADSYKVLGSFQVSGHLLPNPVVKADGTTIPKPAEWT